jgi:hypothetical protein
LLGPDNDLRPFKELSQNLFDQVTAFKDTGKDLHDNKRINWFVEPKSYDMDKFHEQIKKVLETGEKDSNYIDMTQ